MSEPRLGALTREAVNAAIAEFDEVGRDAFLGRYGFGRSTRFRIGHEGRWYDSKAFAGVACTRSRWGQAVLHRYDRVLAVARAAWRALRAPRFRRSVAVAEPWLSAEEIAAHLGITKDTVCDSIAGRRMPAHRVGQLWKSQVGEVDKCAQRRGVPRSGRPG